ncbi:MAG: glycosyltransferase family 4 protein [Candidatus Woykebacteria bacterium]
MEILKAKVRNLNIVHVTSYYPPHLGGMESCVKELTEQLAINGHYVNVFTSNIGSQEEKQQLKKNHRVFFLKSIEFAHTPIIFTLFFKLLKLPRKSIIHIHISQAFTPEIVFLISKLKKIPYIAHVHLDVDPSGPLGFLLTPYKKLFLKIVLKHASRIICLSKLQKNLISYKYSIPKNKISILPNGVGKSFMVKREIKRKDITTLLFVGRLVPQKNVPRLLKAVKIMKKKVHLNIVGEGESRAEIEKIINDLKLNNVSLLGIRRGKELLKLYEKADIFVLPSNKEGIPLALLEAMATGLPIVASNIPGVNELLGDTAILVDKLSPEDFAIALDSLISDKSLQETLSQKVSIKAKKYSWEKITSDLENIYRGVQI